MNTEIYYAYSQYQLVNLAQLKFRPENWGNLILLNTS